MTTEEKIETIWHCGYPDINIMRGVFCWYITLNLGMLGTQNFANDNLIGVIDLALEWSKENRR